jgi:hypothetical protein
VGNGTFRIYIGYAFKDKQFNLVGKNIISENLVLRIFKSINFKDSDTLINSNEFEFIEK